MIDKARQLLDLIRMRRDSLALDGRDGQGVTPTAPEQSTTWIVTQVEPVLMAQPLTGGPAVSIQATDAIKGVKVANRIRVEVRGMGSRVAVALLDQLPITQRDKDERVASIAGKDLHVGGSVSLSADDVGALPVDADLSHNHAVNISSGTCQVAIPGQTASKTLKSGWSSGDSWDTARNRVNDLYSTLNALIDKFNDVVGASAYCDGCADAGDYSTSQGG